MAFPTIAETIQAGTQIGAYCADPCWHGEMLPLEDMGRKLGFDFIVSAATIKPLLRCSKCGGRNCTIRIHIAYQTPGNYDINGRPR